MLPVSFQDSGFHLEKQNTYHLFCEHQHKLKENQYPESDFLYDGFQILKRLCYRFVGLFHHEPVAEQWIFHNGEFL